MVRLLNHIGVFEYEKTHIDEGYKPDDGCNFLYEFYEGR